jgi:hypothetical protein
MTLHRHITEVAIETCITEYAAAKVEYKRATDPEKKEYFFGKEIGIIEAFAALTRMTWIDAEFLLRSRATAAGKLDQ